MAYQDVILADTPVGYWRLGEGATAIDLGSGGNDGTYVNSPSLVNGLIVSDSDGAREWSGTEHVDIGDNLDFVGRAPFSLEAWILPEAHPDDFERIISKELDQRPGVNQVDGYSLIYFNKVVTTPIETVRMIRILHPTGTDSCTAPVGSCPIGQVSHVVGTYDGDEMRLYINGYLQPIAGPTGNPVPSTLDLLDHTGVLAVGAEPGFWGYTGIIDEPAVYDYALSAAQVEKHYVARRPFMVQVDWNGDGDYGDANEDVTGDLQALHLRSGRRQPSGMAEPSVLEVQLRNTDNKYSLENGASPLAGLLLPRRKVRLWAMAGSDVYLQFTGRLDDITNEVIPAPRGIARLNCLGEDYFRLSGPVYTKQTGVAPPLLEPDGLGIGPTTDDGVTDILDQVGWVSGDRIIDTGITEMDWFSLRGEDGSGGIRALTEEELGFSYVDHDGKFVFEARDHRHKGGHLTSQATYTDAAGGTYRYASLAPYRAGIENVYNFIRASARARQAPSSQTVWTLSVPNDSAGNPNPPTIAPNESRLFIATWDNPGSSAYTASFTANSSADGTGADLTAQVTKVESNSKAHRHQVKLTNETDPPRTAYITALSVIASVRMPESEILEAEIQDASSQAIYGIRPFPIALRYVGKIAKAEDWAGFVSRTFKNPTPMVELTFRPNTTAMLTEMLQRRLSDRVTIINAQIGLNDDFFVEGIEHEWTRDRLWETRMHLSRIVNDNLFFRFSSLNNEGATKPWARFATSNKEEGYGAFIG